MTSNALCCTTCAVAMLLLACSGEDGKAKPDATGTGGATTSAGGGVGGAGGAAVGGGGNSMGGGAVDLGWPLDDSLPAQCADNSSGGGTAWDGWANLQFPPSVTVNVGVTTEPVYGRTYRAGETEAVGQAPGWEAELGVGPLGTLPTGEGRCWSHAPATFNVDVGDNDEYMATVTPDAAGLYSLVYRFRPPGGAWRYGDVNGSDDGISVAEAGALIVEEAASTSPLVVATLNLRCRLDDWAARRPLVVHALARVSPDLIAFQEDCVDVSGPSQAEEIRAELATYTRRGYALRRVATHQADSGGEIYEEGISLLSTFPIASSHVLDLPFQQIPRKAIAIDVDVRGTPLRFYTTHFDFGSAAETARQQAAEAIVADLPASSLAIVAGDLNADPAEPAFFTLSDVLTDLWGAANPSSPGATFPSDAPSVRLDYIFVSPLATGALLGAKRLDEASGTTLLSDHLGVVVAFTLP
jgi:endonuclease/exonuclease/phosphatase family metal-dependent hydrolase